MLRVAVVNPTSLSNNAASFASLPFDICHVAESSATDAMQKIHTRENKKHRIHITWGHGVPPQRQTASGGGSKRGQSMGVCVLSKGHIAIRPGRSSLPGHWLETCRIMVSFAQMSAFTVRLITVYGVPSAAPGAQGKNSSLWAVILSLLMESNIPTIIGGDFNCKPQCQNVWTHIAQLGYVELFDLHASKFNSHLPPTCLDATYNDTLVVSRHFASCYRDAFVSQEKLFPAHDPIIATFDVRTPCFLTRNLPMPEPLQQDVLQSQVFQTKQEQETLNANFGALNLLDLQSREAHCRVSECLGKVGSAFEHAYDASVQSMNENATDNLVPARQRTQFKLKNFFAKGSSN